MSEQSTELTVGDMFSDPDIPRMPDPVFLPPGGQEEAGPPNPYVMPAVGFVNFNPDGRIRFVGKQAPGFTYDMIAEGAYVCFGSPRNDGHAVGFLDYVDHDGDDWVVAPRPVLERSFDKLVLEIYTEAVMTDVPPCEVNFTGPVSGSQEHTEQGDLSIGWTVPGTYEVTISLWPYLPQTYTFTVT